MIWSPAASTWGAVLNERLGAQGDAAMTGDFVSFQLTPARDRDARARWPRRSAGPRSRSASPTSWPSPRTRQGWAAHGHPEWGAFRLGKTNPNFSTSGLSALIAQAYAANGKTEGLSLEDLAKPSTDEFARQIESAVVHYGDTTLTFLNNWYRADQRGNPYRYVSAVAVEEKSVIDYNSGNPDGVLQEGEEPREPNVPLVAIYPEEGTALLRQPALRARRRVGRRRRGGGRRAVHRLRRSSRENQEQILELRLPAREPGRGDRRARSTTSNGVDPDQPQTLLEVPEPEVLTQLLDDWQDQRKPARVLLLIDVSGSMSEVADPDTGATKLDLAKQATITALDEFNDDDEVGLWVFSTDLGDRGRPGGQYLELVPTGRIGDVRENLKTQVRDLRPDQRHAALPRHPGRLRAAARRSTTPPASTRWCCCPTA